MNIKQIVSLNGIIEGQFYLSSTIEAAIETAQKTNLPNVEEVLVKLLAPNQGRGLTLADKTSLLKFTDFLTSVTNDLKNKVISVLKAEDVNPEDDEAVKKALSQCVGNKKLTEFYLSNKEFIVPMTYSYS